MLRLFLRLDLIYNLIIKSKIKILDQSQTVGCPTVRFTPYSANVVLVRVDLSLIINLLDMIYIKFIIY